jgi:Matrixin
MTRMAHAAVRATAVLSIGAATATLSCFVGYDSRWGEAKRAQQHAAEDTKPAVIAASSSSSDGPSSAPAHRTFRVRVRPTSRYLGQTVDTPRRVADLFDDANRILEPSLGLHIEVDHIQPWASDADDDLGTALAALDRDDTASDADLVVGLIGALPMQTDSFHQLGMAQILSKHLVVRAASRLGEHDSLEQSFTELSADDRARIEGQRKRHRALAVFLHEIGHTLGALHENDERSLMHPSYSPKMAGFGGGAVALMRIALDGAGAREIAAERLTLLRTATGADWVQSEHDAEVGRLEALTAGPPADAGPAAAQASTAAIDVPFELRGADRDRYVRAVQELHAGVVASAWSDGRPLFAAYPNVYAVQDLRCQLAMLRWLDRDALKAECAPLGRLADAGPLDAGH